MYFIPVPNLWFLHFNTFNTFNTLMCLTTRPPILFFLSCVIALSHMFPIIVFPVVISSSSPFPPAADVPLCCFPPAAYLFHSCLPCLVIATASPLYCISVVTLTSVNLGGCVQSQISVQLCLFSCQAAKNVVTPPVIRGPGPDKL